jgi:hypothetical protein
MAVGIVQSVRLIYLVRPKQLAMYPIHVFGFEPNCLIRPILGSILLRQQMHSSKGEIETFNIFIFDLNPIKKNAQIE